MITFRPQICYVPNQTFQLEALIQTISSVDELHKLNDQVLPELVRIIKAHWIGLYTFGKSLIASLFFSYGLNEAIANFLERSCCIEFNCYTQYPDAQYSMPAFAAPHINGSLQYFPLIDHDELMGLLVTESCVYIADVELWEKFLIVLSNKLTDLVK